MKEWLCGCKHLCRNKTICPPLGLLSLWWQSFSQQWWLQLYSCLLENNRIKLPGYQAAILSMLNPIKGSNDKSSILWLSALPCASKYDCGFQQWLKWRRRGNKFQTKSILFRLQELNLIARALPCCHGFYFSKVINIHSHSAPQKREINRNKQKP